MHALGKLVGAYMGPLTLICPKCGNRSKGAGLEANLNYCCPFCKQRLNLSTGVREICLPEWVTGGTIRGFFTWKRSLLLLGAVLLGSALFVLLDESNTTSVGLLITTGLAVSALFIALALCFCLITLPVGVDMVNEIRIFAKAENKWRAAFPFSVAALAQSEKKTGSGFMRVSEGYKRLSIVVGALTGIGFFSFMAATERVERFSVPRARIDADDWFLLTIASLVLGIAGLFATRLAVWAIKWVIEGFSDPSPR